jgi:hypothetical protein
MNKLILCVLVSTSLIAHQWPSLAAETPDAPWNSPQLTIPVASRDDHCTIPMGSPRYGDPHSFPVPLPADGRIYRNFRFHFISGPCDIDIASDNSSIVMNANNNGIVVNVYARAGHTCTFDIQADTFRAT